MSAPAPDDAVLFAALAEENKHRWPVLLRDVQDVLTAALRRGRVPDAERVATMATLALGEYLGGQSVYLPKGDRLRQAVRDAAIIADRERGIHPADIGRRHGVTERRVNQVVAQAAAERQAEFFLK